MDFAKDCVDEAGGSAFVGAFGEFDRFHHGGMRRNACEVAHLVETHAKQDRGGLIDGKDLAAGEVLGKPVELVLIAENTVDDFMCEGGIAGGEGLGELVEQGVGMTATMDTAQTIEGGAAGGRDDCH